jgi:hypothetical protein
VIGTSPHDPKSKSVLVVAAVTKDKAEMAIEVVAMGNLQIGFAHGYALRQPSG